MLDRKKHRQEVGELRQEVAELRHAIQAINFVFLGRDSAIPKQFEFLELRRDSAVFKQA